MVVNLDEVEISDRTLFNLNKVLKDKYKSIRKDLISYELLLKTVVWNLGDILNVISKQLASGKIEIEDAEFAHIILFYYSQKEARDVTLLNSINSFFYRWTLAESLLENSFYSNINIKRRDEACYVSMEGFLEYLSIIRILFFSKIVCKTIKDKEKKKALTKMFLYHSLGKLIVFNQKYGLLPYAGIIHSIYRQIHSLIKLEVIS